MRMGETEEFGLRDLLLQPGEPVVLRCRAEAVHDEDPGEGQWVRNK
jgi:hypothetical protein